MLQVVYGSRVGKVEQLVAEILEKSVELVVSGYIRSSESG